MRNRVWIPESRVIESGISIKGAFVVELIDALTGTVKNRLEFENLTTNGGLNRIGSGGLIKDSYAWLEVGTGTTPASFTDSTLQSPLSPRSNNSGGETTVDTTNTVPPYLKRKITRVFNENEVNGDLTEIGFWDSSTGGTLVNRSLILDSAGNPTTVRKTPADKLRIVFEYRIYPPQGDVTGVFVLDGVDITYTLRAQGNLLTGNWGALLDVMGQWNGKGYAYEQNFLTSIGSINNPSGGILNTTTSLSSYIPNTFYRDLLLGWGGSYAPSTGLGLVTFSPWNLNSTANSLLYQMMFSPKISKTDLQTLKFTFRISWGRS